MQFSSLDQLKERLRLDRLPHLWCPGCGNGIITQAFLRAVISLDIDPDRLVIVSGIGCSSRVVEYLDFDTVHTAHGRAIPLATGIKLARPSLKAVVLAGDGDIAAIGGNHFIHAARRNIDITVIIFNNFNYGMTGGQYSPLTPQNEKAATAMKGHVEPPFDIHDLARGAGATYIARSTTWHALNLPALIAGGMEHEGFSVIEVIAGCHVNYGKRNQRETAVKMLQWQKEHFLPLDRFKVLNTREKKGRLPIGLLYSESKPEFTAHYRRVYGMGRQET